MEKNLLYYGDNLDVLRESVADEFADLIYLDPPFNSKRNYSVIFSKDEVDDDQNRAQIEAFEDTWHWTVETSIQYDKFIETAPAHVAKALSAYRLLLGENDSMAYLTNMAPRLLEIHRVLKPSGSMYLHCDPTMSHYLKVLLDAIFRDDRTGFLNEIIWSYRTGGMSKRWFGRKHDVLLLYVKDDTKHTFNVKKEKSYLSHKYGFKNVEIFQEPEPDGRYYTMVGMRDVWAIDALRGNNPETLGYPTQKPLALLERVIEASSNEGDIVLDPFCGCGTAVDAAQRLKRSWIGIDIAYTAVNLIQKRLHDTYLTARTPIEETYDTKGIPKDLGAAKDLFERSHFEFERWAVSLLDATPKPRPGGDKGVDGVKQFYLDNKGQLGSIIISVKGGAYGPGDIRDLDGTLNAQGAQMGILISLQPSTRGVRDAVDHGGAYTHPATREVFPRLQHITIDQLLKHEKPRIPLSSAGYIQAAPKLDKGEKGVTPSMFE